MAVRLRAASMSVFMSFLAVLLLSLSCASSACELRCDLSGTGLICHESHSGSDQMPTMAGMKHTRGFSNGAVTLSAPYSCHHLCAPESVLLVQRTDAMVHAFLSDQVMPRDLTSLTAAAMGQAKPVRAPPPLQTASPVSLHTTLCV